MDDQHKKILELLENEHLENQLLAVSIYKGLKNETGFGSLFPKVIDTFEKFCFAVEINLFTEKFRKIEKLSVWCNCNNEYNQSLYVANTKHLDFSTKNTLEKIPTIIFELENIQNVSFTHHRMSTVNKGIKKLVHLEKINLSNNHFQSIPKLILELNQIIELSLSNNQISSIPTDIHSLEKLEVLRLDYNCIGEIPSSIQKMRNLRTLSLEGNNIETIPKEIQNIKSLENLILGNNLITNLPKFLLKMPNLKFLAIDKNPCFESSLIQGKKGNRHIMGQYRIIKIHEDIH